MNWRDVFILIWCLAMFAFSVYAISTIVHNLRTATSYHIEALEIARHTRCIVSLTAEARDAFREAALTPQSTSWSMWCGSLDRVRP